MEHDYGLLEYDNLWQIDTVTGAMEILGRTGVGWLTGLTQNIDNGTIFACNTTHLYTVNPQTGAATAVGPFNAGDYDMACLAFDQTNNILYSISYSDAALFSIDTHTAAATLIGSLGLVDEDPMDCAFDQENGHLFMVSSFNQSFLYYVHTATGRAYKVADFVEETNVYGLALPFGPPDPPQVEISSGGVLTWDPVYRATSYKIYGSDNPGSGFSPLGTVIETSWTDPTYPQGRRFFKVTALTP